MTMLIGQVIFAVNAMILLVLSIVFAVAGTGRKGELYWRSWALSSLVLGLALVGYIVKGAFPAWLAIVVPNGMLILGFGLRWCAAREFSGRPVSRLVVYGPSVLFLLLCFIPQFAGFYGIVYTVVNIALTTLGVMTTWEFLRDRRDRLLSRYGLGMAYGLISLSFGFRVGQGLIEGSSMRDALPQDAILIAHLVVATVYIVASGGFALSLAYERNAARLKKSANHDFLTGLLNRGAFEQKMKRRLADGAGGPMALVLIDIDYFKQINDRFGHAAGDAVLRRCAAIFAAHAGPQDICGRLGGEEFGVAIADPAQAQARTGLMLESVRREQMGQGGDSFAVTASAGIVLCPPGGDYDELLSRADKLLYAAKANGRNRMESIAA